MTDVASKVDSESVGQRVIELLRRWMTGPRRTDISELSDHMLADIGLDERAIADVRRERRNWR